MRKILLYGLLCIMIVETMIFSVNRHSIHAQGHIQTSNDKEALRSLLAWRDPETRELLPLPIDREADIKTQMQELWELTDLSLARSNLSQIPREIGALSNFSRSQF